MLRRKLLIRIGLLVACFVLGAAVAISMLQGTVPEIERINRDAASLIDGVQTVGDCIERIELVRDETPSAIAPKTEDAEGRLGKILSDLGKQPALNIAGSRQALALERLRGELPRLLDRGEQSPTEARTVAASVRASVGELAISLRAYVAAEQVSFGKYLRALVLGLTLAALVMVNVAVFVLLRTAQVVLKPVAELVEGSRELAAERFEHRVKIDQQDEFGELARAYNRLAEQLQANEERKAEALRQLAVTLNHDLNNAMATIEMQLSLLDRQSGSSLRLAGYFRDIHSALGRMGRTVASLKHIRRVVLTEYVDGQKMIDLGRSVVEPPRDVNEVA